MPPLRLRPPEALREDRSTWEVRRAGLTAEWGQQNKKPFCCPHSVVNFWIISIPPRSGDYNRVPQWLGISVPRRPLRGIGIPRYNAATYEECEKWGLRPAREWGQGRQGMGGVVTERPDSENLERETFGYIRE